MVVSSTSTSTSSPIVVGPVLVVAGPLDDDAVGLDRDGHRSVAGPVLGVDAVVLDGGVEPEPVPLFTVVERALERAVRPRPASTTTATAATALAGLVPVAVLVIVGVVVVRVVVFGLSVESGRDQRVVLGAQIRLLLDARARLGVAGYGVGRNELVLALESVDVAHAHLELMRDPGVRTALSDPRANLVQLWLEGTACHQRAGNLSTGLAETRTIAESQGPQLGRGHQTRGGFMLRARRRQCWF